MVMSALLDRSLLKMRVINLGGELHGEALGGSDGARGVFSVPLVVEAYRAL